MRRISRAVSQALRRVRITSSTSPLPWITRSHPERRTSMVMWDSGKRLRRAFSVGVNSTMLPTPMEP